MKKITFFLLCLLLLNFKVEAQSAGNNKNQKQLSDCPGQNLVYNPSFEEITACPTTNNDLRFAKRWSNATTIPSTTLVHSCSTLFGTQYQPPRTGEGYADVVSYNKSYAKVNRGFAQAPLPGTLNPKKK